MTKMLSTREIREALEEVGLKYSKEHISYMIRQGYFPGAVKGPAINSRWRVPEESVEEFIRTKITRIEPQQMN